MMKDRRLSLRSFTFGYRYEEDKEVVSMIIINYFSILLFVFLLGALYLVGAVKPYMYRIHFTLILLFINLLFFRLHYPLIPKYVLLIAIPVSLMVIPSLFGSIQVNQYFWYPYLPVGLAVIPHFILKPNKEVLLKTVLLVLYFLMIIFTDNMFYRFDEGNDQMKDIIREHSFYYNLIPILFFLFINLVLGILNNRNARAEMKVQAQKAALEVNNNQLNLQAINLQIKNRELDDTLRKLHETQSQLIQNEKLAALGTLTAGLAHELNNPLNYISVSIDEMEELLEKEQIPESDDSFKASGNLHSELKNLLGYCREGVERSIKIVKSLGSVKSRKPVNKVATSIKSLVGEVMGLLKYSSAEIRMINAIPSEMICYIIRDEVGRVIRNVIQNALEALECSDHDSLEIRIEGERIEREEDIRHRIRILNNGPSIPEDILNKIFEPFFSTKNLAEGAGLGLSESYNIIRQHNGTIRAENKDGWVMFEIDLPESG